jgi:hypothetical protein
MQKIPQIYHGEWWVPAEADPDNMGPNYPGKIPLVHKGHEKKYMGTLFYNESEDSFLELYHVPSDFHGKHYSFYSVIWGMDANGYVFTLFNASSKRFDGQDFTTIKYKVQFILLGKHVLSLDENAFYKCTVEFPYLRNWAFHNNLTYQEDKGVKHISYADISKGDYLVDVQIEPGIKWLLMDAYNIDRGAFDLSINQYTLFEIESYNTVSIRTFTKQIIEFFQFLSIALYCKQRPSSIKFYDNERPYPYVLLFQKGNSKDPNYNSLIKFNNLKEKLPEMFSKWHNNYDNLSPICNYLVDSLHRESAFDVPDFLIIAQALDGYFKRFVNKKDGKDHQKYEDQMNILLNQFENVIILKKCNIDAKVLTDTRNKYSHLLPDEEKPLAVTGIELYWLTEKCKILLTCCILDLLGLTNEEINLCLQDSPIQYKIDSHPFEFQ